MPPCETFLIHVPRPHNNHFIFNHLTMIDFGFYPLRLLYLKVDGQPYAARPETRLRKTTRR